MTIVQPQAVNVAPHQVTLWWRTDTSATTEVHYGRLSSNTYQAYASHSVYSGLAGTTHSRTLSNLPAGRYFFRVRSDDGAGSAVSGESSFTVLAPAPRNSGTAQKRCATPTPPPSVHFSELHYDNSGTDVNEKIEIEGPAGTDLTGWHGWK